MMGKSIKINNRVIRGLIRKLLAAIIKPSFAFLVDKAA